jgi:hypothetical protein
MRPAKLWAPSRRTLVSARAILATTRLWTHRDYGIFFFWRYNPRVEHYRLCVGHFTSLGSRCVWNLAFEKTKKPWRFRLKFSGGKNGMVLKGIKRHAAWLKDHPQGRLGPQRGGAPVKAFPLSSSSPFFFWGGGGLRPRPGPL